MPEDILHLQLTQLHQRVPLIIGFAEDVTTVEDSIRREDERVLAPAPFMAFDKTIGFIPMWRDHKQTPLAKATTLGYFLLFMKDLEREHYISCEMQPRDRRLMYRLRLVHHTGAFWIQTAKEGSLPLRLVA